MGWEKCFDQKQLRLRYRFVVPYLLHHARHLPGHVRGIDLVPRVALRQDAQVLDESVRSVAPSSPAGLSPIPEGSQEDEASEAAPSMLTVAEAAEKLREYFVTYPAELEATFGRSRTGTGSR